MSYDIQHKLLNYDFYYTFLTEILENPKNKKAIKVYSPIGYSSCGFPIEHYSIGSGPYKVIYMGGAHGNEIIGVDFILQFMKNLVLGNGVLGEFPDNLFQIHFFPLQNPEGFFTTTYAIQEALSDQDQTNFCKEYYLNYRCANHLISSISMILQHFYSLKKLPDSFDSMKQKFWDMCYGQDITLETLLSFLRIYFDELDVSLASDLWANYIGQEKISFPFEYQKSFSNVQIDSIPDKTSMHQSLKNNLKNMFQNSSFSNYMLGNFCANSLGINLNENNEPYFQRLKELIKKEGKISVSPIYGNYPKNISSPFGAPSKDMDHFTYASENEAVLKFLEDNQDSIYAFINCHGTGGMLYFNPYDNASMFNNCDFSFYINNRLATEYLKEVQRSYQRNGGKDSYLAMGYPDCVSGLGDVLRMKYPASFLLELSKAGGNPLGPYVQPNYDLTMIVNMEASMKLLKTILEIQHLYGKIYQKQYNYFGRVTYETRERVRKI